MRHLKRRHRAAVLLITAILCLSAAAILGITTACQELPFNEIARARSAVRTLKEGTQADRWAPAEYQSVEEALKEAEKELTLQRSRWPLSRDYGRTILLFAAIPEEAEMAKSAAEAGRKRAEQEAREALEAARAAIAHARATMMVAPIGDGGRAASGLGSEVDRAERRLGEAQSKLTEGDFRKASDIAGEVLTQVDAALRSLAHASRR